MLLSLNSFTLFIFAFFYTVTYQYFVLFFAEEYSTILTYHVLLSFIEHPCYTNIIVLIGFCFVLFLIYLSPNLFTWLPLELGQVELPQILSLRSNAGQFVLPPLLSLSLTAKESPWPGQHTFYSKKKLYPIYLAYWV